MAPLAEQVVGLAKRADGCGAGWYRGQDNYCYRYSSWYWWGRWVFAGLAILFVLIVFALLFRNSRRRRSRGQQPLYGTGWMAPAPAYYPPPPQYTPHDPAAAYPPPPGGYKPGPNEGYFGNQEGVPLQPPQQTYQRSPDADYAPPPGPPPKPN